MKKVLSLLILFCLIGLAKADLSITNGDFEADTAQTYNVTDWFDTITENTANWWESTWGGPNVSPNETSVMGLSYMFTTVNWAYQSIGYNDLGRASIDIGFDVGSFTDAGGTRDLGVTVAIYESDGSFVPEDAVDIDGAAGITLIDSVDVLNTLDPGDMISTSVTLDLTSAGSGELFLRFVNYIGNTGEPWTAIDNVYIAPIVLPVQPADDSAGENPVPLTQILEWDVLLDGAEYVDVYLSDLDEPNLSNDPGTKVLDFAPVATTTFDPASLDYSTTYYWKVVLYVSDGNGGYLTGSGPAWSFLTVDEAPSIAPVTPDITVVETGENAVIQAVGVNVESYQWYKVGNAAPLSNGAEYEGVTTDTLTILDVQLTDEAYFYCVGTNSVGSASNEETGPGRVMVQRLVNNFTMDSISENSIIDTIDGMAMSLVTDDEVVVGYPTLDSDVVDPAFGSSLNLVNLAENDPNGQYGQLPDGALNLGDMTISTWVKWSGTGNYQRILDFGNDTTEYMFLTPNIDGAIRFAIRTADIAEQQLNSSAAIPDGKWTFIAVTLSGDTAKLYVNGELDATNTAATIDPIDITPSLNYIGKSQWPDPFFNGLIDDVKIYNYARTTEEIAHDYLDVIGGWVCNYEYETLPYDFNNDCLVDVSDFAVFAATWLDSNRIYE